MNFSSSGLITEKKQLEWHILKIPGMVLTLLMGTIYLYEPRNCNSCLWSWEHVLWKGCSHQDNGQIHYDKTRISTETPSWILITKHFNICAESHGLLSLWKRTERNSTIVYVAFAYQVPFGTKADILNHLEVSINEDLRKPCFETREFLSRWTCIGVRWHTTQRSNGWPTRLLFEKRAWCQNYSCCKDDIGARWFLWRRSKLCL
jgi:hypothetical protein